MFQRKLLNLFLRAYALTLGIKIIRDRKKKHLALSQASYMDKVLSRYLMQNSKKGNLPSR